jgi:pimeloyl-ACP methyl ester carboxylesterase
MAVTSHSGKKDSTPDTWQGDACSLVEAFRSGQRSPVEELDATYAAIEASDLNAFGFLDRDRAYESARSANVNLPFGGVPIGIKELDQVAGWPDTEALSMYRSAFMRWPTAHTAIEFHRWAGRSVPRSDGLRYMSRMKSPITADVLHVHGSRDPMMSIDACAGSESFVLGSYALSAMDTGHFPHEENPERFNELLITWLDGE